MSDTVQLIGGYVKHMTSQFSAPRKYFLSDWSRNQTVN